MADDALVITGPTATGKTAVAIELAKRLDGEVISMDSRQVYRGMDVGTAKPSLQERGGIPHHGFDVVDPGQRYSAGRFARDAHRWIGGIRARGKLTILAGGTGFFLRALRQPLFAEPEMAADRRVALDRYLAALADGELRRWAEALDPAAGDMVAGGRQRVARVIEVALLTGRPISWWHAHASATLEPLRPSIFVLELPPAELARRIDARVHDMVSAGLVEEVRGLVQRGFTAADPGMNATGYIELIPVVQGTRDLKDAIALIQAATRRYARRQRTWFRNQLPAGTVRLDAARPAGELANLITARWRKEAAL